MENNDWILERIKNDNGKRYTSKDAIAARNARKKLVKIVINPKHGSFTIPQHFSKASDDNRNIRVVLAEYIENLKYTHSKITLEDMDSFVDNDEWYIKSEDFFFFKDVNSSAKQVHRLKIVEVDTTKKWKIDSYDGAESIVYFEEPKLVDETLNMYEW